MFRHRSLRVAVVGGKAELQHAAGQLQPEIDRWSSVVALPEPTVRFGLVTTGPSDYLIVHAELRDRSMSLLAGGSGVSARPEQAVAASIGELVERLSLLEWQVRDSISSTELDLRRRSLAVVDVAAVLGSPRRPDKYPYPAYSPELTLDWTSGREITTFDDVMVPVALIGSSFGAKGLSEVTTVGTAAGRTRADAEIASLLELIERHQLMSVWFEFLRSLQKDDRSHGRYPPLHGEEIEYVHATAGAYVALACFRSSDRPAFAIGSGASFSPVHALEKAKQERFLMRQAWREQPHAPTTIRTYADHPSYYMQPDRIWTIDAFFSWLRSAEQGGDRRDPGAIVHTRRPLADAVASIRKSQDDYVVSVELAGVPNGRSVVRVLAPLIRMEAREECADARYVGRTYWPHPYL